MLLAVSCLETNPVMLMRLVRHPNQGNPPLALASYFATSHNILSISYFLQSFCHAESTLYRKRSLPKLLMRDGSTALMNAIVLSMFKETFKNYLHRCWLCWVHVASSTWNVFWFGKTTRLRLQASSESEVQKESGFYLNKDWGCVILREIDFLLKICW